jgi:tRNA(Ile2) C34 agmatinyltransferase TiaS
MPTYRVEQRWAKNPTDYLGKAVWCIIDEDGRPFGLAWEPFGVLSNYIERLERGDKLTAFTSSDPKLSRRAPHGVEDEEQWLRENDTRHPEYIGA